MDASCDLFGLCRQFILHVKLAKVGSVPSRSHRPSKLKSAPAFESVGPSYVALHSADLPQGEVKVWHSPETEDSIWDGFLESTPFGQFQQGSAWAQYKQSQNWCVFRVVLTVDDRVVGGFQILWKPTRFGRIGYASKGPVLQAEDPDLVAFIVRLLQVQAAKLRLQALVVQPPDFSVLTAEQLRRARFRGAEIMNVIDASWMIDLSGESAGSVASFSQNARNHIRRAERVGTFVREGGGHEAADFFRLMASTCEHQGVAPNPPTPEAVQALWTAMSRRGNARLTFAECDGQLTTGLLCVLFGSRCSLFKVGWNRNHANWYPNELQTCEALAWAKSNGFLLADWVGISRRAAKAALENRNFEDAGIRSADVFKAKFGGGPVLLPAASVWMSNPLLRYGYRFAGPALAAAKSWSRRRDRTSRP